MVLAVRSWKLRSAARAAIGAGQFEQAIELAAKAQEAQRTPAGEALRMVGKLLVNPNGAGCQPAAGP